MLLLGCKQFHNPYHSFFLLGILCLAALPNVYGFWLPGVLNSSTIHGEVNRDENVRRQVVPSIDVVSVTSIAMSVANRMSQYSTVAAIPLPTDLPHYKELRRLADMMPIVQNDVRGSADDQGQPEGGNNQPDTPQAKPRSILERGDKSQNISPRAGPLRVMIVGDSMTQGAPADWTWRYRIWEWFRAQNIAVDFVGPYVGTQDNDPAGPPKPPPLYGETSSSSGVVRDKGSYAPDVSKDFDSDHFSVWGRAAATDRSLIADILRKYPADVMLLMLGFNDVGWFYSDACGTLDSIRAMVQASREVNPNLKFAIANIVQRTSLGRQDLPAKTDTYNALLRDSLPRWNTTQSPIGLVELRENYSCELSGCPAGYDGLHPGTLGDYQIAQAFSRTLVSALKIGTAPLQIPAVLPSRAKPVPSNFNVIGSPGGILATWDSVYTARGYDVRSRIAGITDWSMGYVQTNRYDQTWALEGATYDIQVRVSLGENEKGEWTDVRSAVAHPQTAPAPANATVRATSTGFDISFAQPTGPYTDSIFLYNLIFWDLDTECAYLGGAGFKTNNIHIDGLNPGHRYLVAIAVWNAAGGGFPGVYNGVVVGAGTPPPPSNFRATAKDNTSIVLQWDKASSAYGYSIWSRNINDGSKLHKDNGLTTEACAEGYFLFPGVWNYEFCVSAANGNAESGLSQCVTPQPAPADGRNAGLSCPVPPKWCANGGNSGGAPGGGGGGGGGGSSSCPATSSLGNGSGASSTANSGPSTTVITSTTMGADGKVTVITRTTTVTVTTTTNSGGAITSSSSRGTITTTTPSRTLTTYSTFPPNASWSSTYVQSNTHDSSGNPVLAPWPTCWFCPGGSNGIVIIGFPPGVYPSGGPPPGLPTPFPPITVGFDGNPTYSSSPSGTQTKTSTSCTTTSTVSECTINCKATARTPTTAYSCKTTCSNTQMGCGVTGSSRTTTKTATYPAIGDLDGDDFVITSDAAYAAEYSSDSSAAKLTEQSTSSTAAPSSSKTASSSSSPSATPVAGNPLEDKVKLNVYGNADCTDFIMGYTEDDLYNKCIKFPRTVRGYQFVEKSFNCMPDNEKPRNTYTNVLLYKTNTCPAPAFAGKDEVVGGGCGDVRTCQKTSGDATAIRAQQVTGGG